MTLEVFDYTDYRNYLRDYLHSLPHRGYGQLAVISRALSLNPSTLTLVLQDQKDFTPEQANDLCEHLGFTELESQYFMNLVALSRAGKANLKTRIQSQLLQLKKRSKELKARIPPQTELSEEAKAIFYSQWYYSGVRLLTSIDGFNSVDTISSRLQLPRNTVKRVLDFLVITGLCIEHKGKFKMGPQSTHIGSDSPLVSRHHQNWRQKAIERADRISGDELIFTSPVSISRDAIPEVRKKLVRTIEDCFKIIDPSACEELMCLSLDWIKL